MKILNRIYKQTVLLLIVFIMCFGIMSLKSQPWMESPYLTKNKSDADFYDIQKAFYSYKGNKSYADTKGFKHFKRWEYNMQPKVFPDGKFPHPLKYWNEYNKFMEHYKSKDKKSKSNGSWTPLGLTTWINGTSGYNPGNGRVNAVTVSPASANTIYAATPSGGIWKTIDGGITWNTTYDEQPLLGTSAIAVDQNNSNIVYVGTGDRDSYDTKSIGLYKSTDGGATWDTTGLNYSPNYTNVNKIIINPLNSKTLYAALGDGIHRSYDAGNTWQQVLSGKNVKNILFKPNDTTVIYACGNSFFKSTDSGNSFNEITSGLPANIYRAEIAVTSANPNYVYLVASTVALNYGLEGIYRSTNSGASFTTQTVSPNLLGHEADGSDYGGMSWFDLAIAVSPINANEVYVGGVNIWKSLDGGVNWTISTHWIYDISGGYEYSHADIHSLNFYGNKLYAGTDGGVFYTSNGGTNWVNISSGLGITQCYRMGGSESNSNLIVTGTQDNGCNKYSGSNWIHIFGGDGMECIIHPSSTNIIYISAYYGWLMKSIDGGNTFNDVYPVQNGEWVAPYVMHPTNPQILFAGYTDVYKTVNGASNWTTISSNLTSGQEIDVLEVAPSNPNYIYVSEKDSLYKTTDGGLNWTSVVPENSRYITGIAIDNNNPLRIWLSLTSSSVDKVLASTDGGSTFNDITGNLTNMGFNCIEYHNNSNDGIYLGTNAGVFYKDSILANWIPFDDGLPNVQINELEINYKSLKIRAATYGRGIWESYYYGTGVNIKERELDNSVNIYPNPATDVINMDFEFEKPADVKIYLFNVVGVLVKNAELNNITKNTYRIDVSDLVVGTYYARIQTDDSSVIKKIVLTK